VANDLNGVRGSQPVPEVAQGRASSDVEPGSEHLPPGRGKDPAAAVELGINRPTLYESMEKLGVGRE